MKQQIDKNWEIYNESGLRIQGSVPGDITADLFKTGKIADPYFGLNHKELGWILETDFTYCTTFDVREDIWECEDICLTFDGIDIFAEIYLNGKCLGTTENMFLQYQYSVKDIVQKKDNFLEVKMLSTKKKMSEIDTEDYWGIFNDERLFIRKAQCHFGWDWAPDMPGYGICKPVWVEGRSKHRFTDVSTRTYNNGKVCVFTELNYDIIPVKDRYGKPLEEIPEYVKSDRIIYKIAKEPYKEIQKTDCLCYEQLVQGAKNFANFEIDNPKLWWPSGYGDQPMYFYQVELVRDGKVLDTKEGKLAFREVRLEQEPIAAERLECKLVVNGIPIFVKGSNWVPMECFTGEMRFNKYEKLLTQARDGNMNMLRVWGGGIYENDIFYELCDQMGIMIWQDMMFACADIPEEKPEFMENVKKEIDYQIRRLRCHPSIVLWSGGNEKVGSICKQVSHGDFFVDVILRGMIANMDDSRPIIKQSPHGMTELANDTTSGDSHISAYEVALELGMDKYRDLISENVASFVSECTLMGPGSLESYQKVFPQDKMWPMNEYWDDRLSDNPYATIVMSFAKRQKICADRMYGECTSAKDFIKKGMTVHAEHFRAESEYARSNKGNTWGFMNWMYSDTWPSGSLSLVDYYCEPKQVYYQMRRSYVPILVTFTQNHVGETVLSIVNDKIETISGELEYGLKNLDGTICWSQRVAVEVAANGTYWKEITEEFKKDNTYLYVTGTLNDIDISNIYSDSMWMNCKFESDYSYHASEIEDGMIVTVKARKFAKGITLKLPENEKYTYSDNYFDLQAWEEKTVVIRGKASVEDLVVTDFAQS